MELGYCSEYIASLRRQMMYRLMIIPHSPMFVRSQRKIPGVSEFLGHVDMRNGNGLVIRVMDNAGKHSPLSLFSV